MAMKTWFTSSYSGANGGECVEVCFDEHVGVRDSKDRAAGQLAVSAPAWDALLAHALSRKPWTSPRI